MEWVKHALLLLLCSEVSLAVSEVTYVCFTKGHNAVRLVCPKGKRIRVVEARYGRSRWGACVLAAGVGVEAQACTQQTMEYTPCCGQSTCLMPAKAVYMPACGYQSHFLRIIHDCVKDEPVVCGPSMVGIAASSESKEDAENVRDKKKINSTLELLTDRNVIEIIPVGIPVKKVNQSAILVNSTRTKEEPINGHDEFHLAGQGMKKRKHPEKHTIMGFDAVIVWSFLGVGLFIVIILSLILILLCRQSPKKKRKVQKHVTESGELTNSKGAHYGAQLYFDDYRESRRKYDNYINTNKEIKCHDKGNVKGHINPGYYADTTGKRSDRSSRTKSSPTTSLRSGSSGISSDCNEEIRRPQPSIRSNKTSSCGGGCKLNIESYSSSNIPLNNVCGDRNPKPKLKPKPVFN